MNLAHEAVHVLITGMSGKGKSTLTRSLIQKDRAPWKFGFDTYKKEFPRCLGWPLCIDEPGLKRAALAGRPSAFYSAPLFPGNRPEGFEFWIRWVYEVGKPIPGRKLVVIEEIEKTTAHINTPLAVAFGEMLDEGRAAQFDVWMIAQRLSTVNKNIRSTLTDICTFQHTDPDQLDWLEREKFDRAAVEQLERGEYIWKDREAGTFRTNAKRKAVSLTSRK
jgi:hypothetical protein